MHGAGPEGLSSMKAQFKKADASGARYALVFGAAELAAGQVAVKPLRADAPGALTEQTLLPLAQAGQWAARLRA